MPPMAEAKVVDFVSKSRCHVFFVSRFSIMQHVVENVVFEC